MEYSARFDGVEQTDIAVPAGGPAATPSTGLDPAVRAGLEESIRRLRADLRGRARAATSSPTSAPGARVTQRMVPVDRVGLYVPGGIAPLVSSVVMNVVPAQVAGVGVDRADLARRRRTTAGCRTRRSWPRARCSASTRCTPSAAPRPIAMFAYGAGPCRPVDLVTGPGNIYTVAAKRLLKGVVGIDSEAGPTEIAILADDTADAAYVAADLISQAEHDPMAASVLVTASERLADEVEAELDKQVSATRHAERIRTALTGQQSGDRAGRRPRAGPRRSSTPTPPSTSRSRPRTPPRWAARVRNAGAIFVGSFAPVSLGDYCAGSNHVLPDRRAAPATPRASRCARSCKSVHVVEYSREALARGRRPRRRRSPRPRTCPATAPRSGSGSRT